MNNTHLRSPKDESDIRWFLLNGGIYDAIRQANFESFRKDLWLLLVAMTSREEKPDKEKLNETIDRMILMVKGCSYFLHHKKRLKYRENWIDIKWYRNPYRCMKKYRSSDDRILNHHSAHFEERFKYLKRKEVQNFTLAFENFFKEIDLSTWLNLLDDWKSCLLQEDSLYEWGADCAPLKTYEKFSALLEACVVSLRWATTDYPPPNRHLFRDFLGTFYDSYRDANPLEQLRVCFHQSSHKELEEIIKKLYNGNRLVNCHTTKSGEDIRYLLRWLIQTGWLLLQTDYFPEDWLKPNSFYYLRCPIPETEVDGWNPPNITNKEAINLRKTLSKLYYNLDIREEIYLMEDRILYYLEGKGIESTDESLKSQDRLLKILDVLALVSLDLIQRRTKLEGVDYPTISDFDKETKVQTAKNETESL